jgi:hypothetical protein
MKDWSYFDFGNMVEPSRGVAVKSSCNENVVLSLSHYMGMVTTNLPFYSNELAPPSVVGTMPDVNSSII